jgi:4-aminobutyrate aminotransferase-like enzyme
VLRLIPSLLLEQQDWDEGLAILDESLAAISAEALHAGRAA